MPILLVKADSITESFDQCVSKTGGKSIKWIWMNSKGFSTPKIVFVITSFEEIHGTTRKTMKSVSCFKCGMR